MTQWHYYWTGVFKQVKFELKFDVDLYDKSDNQMMIMFGNMT